MKASVFEGVCTALVTPFRDGSVDLETFDLLLERQIANGVSAVCVCGTTGESATLHDEEKLTLIERAVKTCDGRMTVIAGTGSNDTSHAIALSKAACDAGADAVLVVTPYYNKATENGLIAHYTAVADAVEKPVILYNVPSRTGVHIPLSVYRVLQHHPRIVGVKEASGDVAYATQILTETEELTLWSGNDDLIVPLTAIGGKGVISVLSNLCPSETEAICKACRDGDYEAAAARQREMTDLIGALFCEVNPIPIKTAMSMLGYPVGTARLPLCEMSDKNLQILKSTMKKHGLI
ncbi:MAG: 4-hydroxy-tetrahydrodipicolinate synthase [Oscillospiraceae bacterium]|nr:4-hydroxy-tetrahydrodipicolinate synthase [Oscillospiraceae bacterium]